MSHDATHAAKGSTITGLEAQLFVSDIAASCAFYKEKLGFTVSFIYGEPPFYAQVARDAARLNLRHVDEPVFAQGIREKESILSATLTLSSVAAIRILFAAYEAAGVPFAQPLQKEDWGATTFITRDPDGNLLLFAAPAD
jgi:catechol 2,3-dioxygenase-like lactoylglutathione lyase family enzyme